MEAGAALDMRWVLLALLLVLDVWSIWLLVRAPATARERWLWSGVILLCPILGCIIWYVLGPKPDLLGGRRGRPPGARG